MKVTRGEGQLYFECSECSQDEHDWLLQINGDEGYVLLCIDCLKKGLKTLEEVS